MTPLNESLFLEEGMAQFPGFLDRATCKKFLDQVSQTRDFSSALFLSEEDYRKNPVHKHVNPGRGVQNLLETMDTRFLEENPQFIQIMTQVLGENYEILLKKFVVGVPDNWMPEWLQVQLKDQFEANLGAYIKPEFRDMTYFHGIDLHQDVIDYKHYPSNFITVYVYLDDTTAETSPLFVVPKSHQFGATVFPHDVQTDGQKVTYADRRNQSDTFDLNMLTGPGGSMYFWHTCTLHGTQPHLAKEPRISLRYLIQQTQNDPNSLLQKINRTIQGPLALETTRDDLDEKGIATKVGNVINQATQ